MPEHPGFELDRVQGRSIVRLRVRPGGAARAIESLQLPAALQWKGGDPSVCWLAPDQWLFTSDTLAPDDIISTLSGGLEDGLHAATDLSSGYACFKLKGRAARTVLAMGCGVDMHPRTFTPGQCLRTRFAHVSLLIVAVGEDHFDLYPDRSHARHLAEWIRCAGEDPLTEA